MNVYFVSCRFVFKRIHLLLASPVVMIIFVWCALYVAPVSGPPRPASKFRAYTYIVNRTVEAKFTWKAGYDWKMPQYFELDQKDFDSQIWVEVYKISEESDRSVVLELEHSQKYEFRVRACNMYGCSRSNTPEVQFTTDSTYCIKDGDLLVGKLFLSLIFTKQMNKIFCFFSAVSPILSKEEQINVFPTLLKTGIILGGILLFIGTVLAVWGYWRSRKRKSRRYRAVRYSTSSYIT